MNPYAPPQVECREWKRKRKRKAIDVRRWARVLLCMSPVMTFATGTFFASNIYEGHEILGVGIGICGVFLCILSWQLVELTK